MKDEIEDYVDDCYKKYIYLKSYSWGLEPLNGAIMWPNIIENPVAPPPFKNISGRPKQCRKKSAYENQGGNAKDANKLSRHRVQMQCKICYELGHNRRGCPRKDNPQIGRAHV